MSLNRAGIDRILNHIGEKYRDAVSNACSVYNNFNAMFSLKRKTNFVQSTPFSEFIRNASSAEKKRVYKRVLEKASESQNRVLARITSAK